MSEFQLTHVALVGARMSSFKPYGYQIRTELSLCRVAPDLDPGTVKDMAPAELRAILLEEMPLWIHNIIHDPLFPGRDQLVMALRRFEGELGDNKTDEVVATVLSAGFKNKHMDPLNLPKTMPMRQRCAMVMHLAVWQLAYRELETAIVRQLSEDRSGLMRWLEFARQPMNRTIEEGMAATG